MTAPQAPLVGIPTLLTAEEAATALRVKASWLERQAASRNIPFTMLGGCYRFTAEHLCRIVEIFEAIPAHPTHDALPTPGKESRTSKRQPDHGMQNVTPLRARPRQVSGRNSLAA